MSMISLFVRTTARLPSKSPCNITPAVRSSSVSSAFPPGLRIYKGCDDIPRVMNGLGWRLFPRRRA